MGSLERFQRRGVAVGPRPVVSGSFHSELDFVVGQWAQVPVLVHDADGHEGQVFPVRSDAGTVDLQLDVVRLARRVHFPLGHGLSGGVVCHYPHRARFVFRVHPHEAVACLPFERGLRQRVAAVLDGDRQILGAFPLALSVDEHFRRGIVRVDENGRGLAFPPFPVPMGQDMEGLLFFVPMASVKIIAVFGNSSQVHYPEQGGVAGPVGIIGRGFSQIVKSRPHEFPDAIGQILLMDEIVLRKVRPAAMLHVVRRRLVVGVAVHGAALHGEFVHAPRAERGGGLRP